MSADHFEEAVDRMRERFPLKIAPPEVLEWIDSSPEDAPWAVACSGGADSTFLVLFLIGHFPLRRHRIHILHYDHATRGEAHVAERAQVREMADRLGLRFHSETRAGGGTDEGSLRNAREDFFARAMRENGCAGLFLGHNQSDIVETILIRLARGAGSEGLAAPRPCSGRGGRFSLRPLLGLDGARIRDALKDFGIHWMEDSSNATGLYLRNRLRNSVMPAWALADPDRDLFAAGARSRRLLEEDAGALAEWTERVRAVADKGDRLEMGEAVRTLPRAIRRRLIEKWMARGGYLERLSASWVEGVLDRIERGQEDRISAGPGLWVEIGLGGLRLCRFAAVESGWSWQPLVDGIRWHLPNGAILRVDGPRRIEEADRLACENKAVDPRREVILASPEGLSGGFRNRRPGDRFHSLGGPGSRRLRDCLVDLGVASHERASLPVIGVGQTVWWVPGFPPAEACRVGEGTKSVLRLTYEKP